MNKLNMHWRLLLVTLLVVLSPISQAHAIINGLSGTTFNFTAKAGHISTGDGASLLFWGFADTSPTGSGVVQYPGPTLILNEGDKITITLANELAEPVSMVFPGMAMTSATAPVFKSGVKGNFSSLTPEAAPNGTRTYTFTATKAGTYYYESGSNQSIQLRMGLFGAIVVRPATYKTTPIPNVVPFGLNDRDLPTNPAARHPQVRLNYNDSGIGGVAYNPSSATDLTTAYDREFLIVGSEMDPDFHKWMEFGGTYDLTKWKSNYWFFNGRNAPDTMDIPNSGLLPSQPYNAMPLAHPGERVLVRLVNLGQEFHPFHHHGNHSKVIAVDGNLLSSNPGNPGAGADLSWLAFTETMAPGKTMDTIFTWSGANLGWDIYADTARVRPYEYMADHGKTYQPNIQPVQAQTNPPVPTPAPKLPPQGVPIILPGIENIIAGANFSGSPYMGVTGALPPGEGGFNPLNGYFFMFHSHAELEITNNNTFPGGMLTMMGIIPWPDNTTGPDNLDPATDMYMP